MYNTFLRCRVKFACGEPRDYRVENFVLQNFLYAVETRGVEPLSNKFALKQFYKLSLIFVFEI